MIVDSLAGAMDGLLVVLSQDIGLTISLGCGAHEAFSDYRIVAEDCGGDG